MEYSEYHGSIRTLIEKALQSRTKDEKLTLKYCAEIKEYAKKNNDAKLLGFAYYYIGEIYYVLNDGEKLFRNISQAIPYLDESEQWDMLARAYNIMGINAVNSGNAPVAMDYYLTGQNCCRRYKLGDEGIFINLNLGSLYLVNEQYKEAQQYYEDALQYAGNKRDMEMYNNLMACIHINLGQCYLQQGMTERAQDCIDFVEKECASGLQTTEILYVLCFKAKYYHTVGKTELRDECIEEFRNAMNDRVVIMDAFDDFCGFCRLLLEIGNREDVFWDVVELLEKPVENSGVVNFKRKLSSLKIQYYREHQEQEAYLRETAVYYELVETIESEYRDMVSNMLRVRKSLEFANEKRRKVERANVKLQKRSETDVLTHLPNRLRLEAFSETAFERAKENQIPLAIEILDVDYFKEYNDNYGHQAGDTCLTMVAEELRAMQSEKLFCARYGGDEFIIIYEGMSADEVWEAAEALQQRIVARAMEHAYSKALPIVTISQGICHDMVSGESSCWDFLHTADKMLYRVKQKSRNNILIGRLDETEIHVGS